MHVVTTINFSGWKIKQCRSNFIVNFFPISKQMFDLKYLINCKATLNKRWLTSEQTRATEWFQSVKKTSHNHCITVIFWPSDPDKVSSPITEQKQSKSLHEDSSHHDIHFHSSHHKFTSSLIFSSPLAFCISQTSPSLSCGGKLRWRQRVQPSWRRHWHSMGRLRGWSAHTGCAAEDAPIPTVEKHNWIS